VTAANDRRLSIGFCPRAVKRFVKKTKCHPATEIGIRHRFWLIGAIFALAFMNCLHLHLRFSVFAALVGCGVGVYLMQNFISKGRHG
jgi:hypothetical protein